MDLIGKQSEANRNSVSISTKNDLGGHHDNATGVHDVMSAYERAVSRIERLKTGSLLSKG